MSGPVSLPTGPKARWEELNEIVCNIHFNCDMDPDKKHEYVTYRMWLLARGRRLTAR